MLRRLTFAFLALAISLSALALTVEEKYVDFLLSPATLQGGDIHVGYEWLKPNEFIKRNVSIMDRVKIASSNPSSNQIIASKIGFVSKRKFDDLSSAVMNQSSFIANMLNSVSVKKLSGGSWRVTNKVKAYGLPFNVGFDLKLTEASVGTLSANQLSFLRDEASVLKSSGRERILIVDMTNFSQLMYRNYSIVYMKEIGPSETLIVSALIASFDINMANTLFNFQPFSTARSTMMGNLKEQIMQMAKSIQK